MTNLSAFQFQDQSVTSSMSALSFLELYSKSGVSGSYLRGAKSYLEFCFKYTLPIQEASVSFYATGKSPASKTFAKRCTKFYESLGVGGLHNDLRIDKSPKYHASIEAFLKGSVNINSEDTRKTYASVLNKYFAYCFRNDIKLFCLFSTIKYKDSMVKSGDAASSVNTALTALRSMARYILENRDKIDVSKEDCDNLKEVLLIKNVRMKGNTYRKPELSEEEREMFMQSITDDDHRLQMSLMAYEGLRRGEIPRVCIQDFDFENKTISVRGKGYISDPVPVKLFDVSFTIAKRLISARKQKKGQIFPELKKELVSSRAIHYFKESGIMRDKLSAHSLRHTALQVFTNNGAPIEIVRLQARHESIATTQHYTNKAIQRRFLDEIEQYE